PSRPEVVLFNKTGDRFETEGLGLLHFERRRIDQRPRQAECLREESGDDTGRAADVEHRLQSSAFEKRPRERRALDGVVPLLGLNRLRVDESAMKRADKRAVDAVVEAAVR